MQKKSSVWQTVLVLIILGAAVFFILLGMRSLWVLFWEYISHSTPEIGAAIIAGSVTIIVSVLTVVLGRIFERNKEINQKREELEQEIRQQYLPMYQELVVFLFKVLDLSKSGQSMPEKEMAAFFADFTQKILVWGSDSFLKDFSSFRDSSIIQSSQKDPDKYFNPTVVLALEKLLYSIRSDCGHKNKGLGQGDLLVLFINDIRKYL